MRWVNPIDDGKKVWLSSKTISISTIAALAVQRYIYVCHATVAKQWCTLARSVHTRVSVKYMPVKKVSHAAFYDVCSRFSMFSFDDGESLLELHV